jgi:hypothetical protein
MLQEFLDCFVVDDKDAAGIPIRTYFAKGRRASIRSL